MLVETNSSLNTLFTSAKLQLRGQLQMVDFEQRVIPKKGLEDMVLTDNQRKQLNDIISFEKARKVLFGHWVFILYPSRAMVQMTLI